MEISKKGRERIEKWAAAFADNESCKAEARKAEAHLKNAIIELGGLAVPPEIGTGETVLVWYDDSIIAITQTASLPRSFKIEIRKLGQSLIEKGL